MGYYSHKNILDQFTQDIDKIGLWESEKYLINKYMSSTDNVLDLGCGAGRVAINLFNIGYANITGADICSEMITQAKLNNDKIKFVVADATNLSFADRTFDSCVFSFNGLMLIGGKENIIKAVKEIHRVLKSGGIFIFSTDDRRDLPKYDWFWQARLDEWMKKEQDQRLQYFGEDIFDVEEGQLYFYFPTKEEMVEVLNRAGFIILEEFPIKSIDERQDILEYCGDNHLWVCRCIA